MKIRIDGRTDLHNYYPESWQRRDSHKAPRSTGVYTTRRSRQIAVCIGKLHADIVRRNAYRAYFITHTTARDMVNQRPVGTPGHDVDRMRRRYFSLFLDMLRKQDGFRGYFWVTERHSGGGENDGTIHHHCVAYFAGTWDYRNRVQRWSRRYCGSNNGLDIAACKTGRAGAYIAKAIGYTVKDMVGLDSLPFRWWGTTMVVRYVQGYMDEHPVTTPAYNPNQPYTVRCAVVSDRVALDLCREATENRRLQKWKTELTLKRHKGKGRPAHQGKINKQ